MSSPSGSRSAAPSEEHSDSLDPGRVSSKARRVTITAACNECRKRKVRCDGARPTCASCRRTGRQECKYDTAHAETHGQARKRRHAELQTRSDVYRDIFAALKVGQDDNAQGILRQIRAGADVEALLANLTFDERTVPGNVAPTTPLPPSYEYPFDARMPSSLIEDKIPYLGSILYERIYLATPRSRQNKSQSGVSELPQMYHTSYHAVDMVDPRIDAVRAAPWTNVISDDALLRHLLRLYFIFEYPFAACFHKDLFLEDMMTGRNRFCSPLLVNAILAVASHCHSGMPDRAEYWRPRSLGYQLTAEAKRLWELERDEGTLTTVQAGMIICTISVADGIDKVGWSYLVRTVAIGNDLGLFSRDHQTTKRKTRLARAFTAWGIFAYQSAVSYQLHKAPLLGEPPEEPLLNLSEATLHYPEIWVKYPLAEHAVASDFSASFIATAELCVILNEITRKSFAAVRDGDRFRGFRLEETLRYYHQLGEWYESLPEEIGARRLVLPHQMKIHMQYWTVLIGLFEPLIHEDLGRRRSSLSNLLTYEKPEEIVEHSHHCLEMVIRLYYIRHGFESCDSPLCSFLTLVAFRALREYQDEVDGSEASRAALSTLILCAKGLRDQGQSYYVAEAAYRLLRTRMFSSNPAAVVNLDEAIRIEDDDERDELVSKHISSLWLMAGVGSTDDANNRRIQDIFRDVSRMELDESSERSSHDRWSESIDSS